MWRLTSITRGSWGTLYLTYILKQDLSGTDSLIIRVLLKSLHVLSFSMSEMTKAFMNERTGLCGELTRLRCVTLGAQIFQGYLPVLTALSIAGSTRILLSLTKTSHGRCSCHEAFFSDIHLIAHRDWNELNNRVFFVRVNGWSSDFLTQVATFPRSRPNVDTSAAIETQT